MVSTSIIKIKNLRMGYGAVDILKGVSFSMKSGRVLGLAGLNGVGKTTLIKGLLGLQKIKSGDIIVLEACPAARYVKRRIAYLPEHFEPPAFLTGMEFLEFVLNLYHQKKDEDRIIKMAASLGLAKEALSKRTSTYSKGMRQKLGLMGVMLSGSELLILDEPMSGLDPQARKQIKEAIKCHKKQGVSIFLSSHILGDMAEICDDMLVLHAGYIMFKGTPDALCKLTKRKKSAENLENAFFRVIENKEAA